MISIIIIFDMAEVLQQAWTNSMKWCLVHADEKYPNLNELQTILWKEYTPPINRISALHLISETNNMELVKLLLAHDIPIDSRDRTGSTPLHWAAFKGNLNLVRLLLDNNANTNLVDYGKYYFKYFISKY